MAGGNRLVERILVADGAEACRVSGAEAGDGDSIEQDLGHGLQHEFRRVAGGALGQRIEGADRFQRVSEQVETQRFLAARREYVEDAAAHRVLARLARRADAVVAVAHEVAGERRDIQLATRASLKACRGHRRTRWQALGGGRHRRQQHPSVVGSSSGEPRQRRHALAEHHAGRRHPVIRHAVPARERHHVHVGGEERQCLRHRRELNVAGGEMQRAARAAARDGSEGQGVQPFRSAGNPQAAAGGRCQEHIV